MVQFKSDLVNARAGAYVEAREVKPPRRWRHWSMTSAERSSSHTIFACPRMRTDERSGGFGFGQSGRNQSDLSPLAKPTIALRHQAMPLRLTGRGSTHAI